MATDVRVIAIGVDIGGTFTDVVLLDEASGGVRSAKVLTTPERPEQGVLDAVESVLRQEGAVYADVRTYLHGTTLATNAIIERKARARPCLRREGFAMC